MGLFPSAPGAVAPVMISMHGCGLSPFAYLLNAVPGTFTQAIGGAGTAFVTPINMPDSTIIQKGYWLNGATSLTGSLQVGVYSDKLALIAASATAVQAGASVLQEVAISPAVTIPRGLVYIVIASSGAASYACYNAMGGSSTIATQLAKATALLLANPVYPLPDSLAGSEVVTPAGAGLSLVYGVSSRALVV